MIPGPISRFRLGAVTPSCVWGENSGWGSGAEFGVGETRGVSNGDVPNETIGSHIKDG